MTATNANLYVDAGVDFATEVELVTDENTPVDITDESFIGAARKVFSSAKAFDLTITVESDEVGDVITLSIPGAITAPLDPGKYYYDVLMAYSNGTTVKILEGIIFILPTMTTVEAGGAV